LPVMCWKLAAIPAMGCIRLSGRGRGSFPLTPLFQVLPHATYTQYNNNTTSSTNRIRHIRSLASPVAFPCNVKAALLPTSSVFDYRSRVISSAPSVKFARYRSNNPSPSHSILATVSSLCSIRLRARPSANLRHNRKLHSASLPRLLSNRIVSIASRVSQPYHHQIVESSNHHHHAS